MEMLKNTVKLSPVNTELPLKLYTDASYGSIGYCLVQPRGGVIGVNNEKNIIAGHVKSVIFM